MNLAVLRQSEDNMNRLLQEMRDVVTQLSLDSDLLRLMLTADGAWSPQTLYQFSLQRKELDKLVTNRLISRLYVHLERSKTILSPDLIARENELPVQIGDHAFDVWLHEMKQKDQLNRFVYLPKVHDGTATANYLAYVGSLPVGSGRGAEATAILLIDEQSILNMLGPLLVHSHSFAYIADGNNSIVASASADGKPVTPISLSVQGSGNYFFEDRDGRPMLITYTRSTESGWTFISGLPTSVVFSKAEFIKRINWAIALTAVMMTAFIALLFAYRNSKPLLELVEILRESTGSTDLRHSEMDVLKDGVQQMIHKNRSMHVRMNRQLPILQATYLERLLKDGFHHQAERMQHQKEAQMEIFEDHVIAAVIQIYGLNFVSRDALEGQLDQTVEFITALNQLLQRGCYIHQVKRDQYVYIYSWAGEVEESSMMSALIGKLSRMQQELLQRKNIVTGIGIGQCYPSSSELWRSFHEAIHALEMIEPDAPSPLLAFHMILHQDDQYYYPLEMELKLMNTVRTGDQQGLEQVFEHIETQNFQLRKLNAKAKLKLLLELEGTLYKLADQTRYTLSDSMFSADPLKAVHGHDRDQMYPLLKSIFASMCSAARQKQDHQHESMLSEIVSFIHEQFTDSNLNLRRLASDYKQTESALSSSFKDHMGVTFSEYVENLRLDKACMLLTASDLAIQDVALQSGYNSDKSFRRAFKRVYGILPTDYRKASQASSGGA
ncbi:AraC-like DNA-binding protein [Paenibacillus rhizosphaerae]|uniref:AraC-like DNA-binding protein n=1 Tax=Paenibacillus rhizosphaerae TaxID=297318 RepID=A0A839TNA3_9BACL|nr:helix-turn-helix domain-containing protein [Paenibacillus rhizosphaerae]MBB3128286.1 AraC-like DNA-binding protein [Paenibacillus rhizosphaerae]